MQLPPFDTSFWSFKAAYISLIHICVIGNLLSGRHLISQSIVWIAAGSQTLLPSPNGPWSLVSIPFPTPHAVCLVICLPWSQPYQNVGILQKSKHCNWCSLLWGALGKSCSYCFNCLSAKQENKVLLQRDSLKRSGRSDWKTSKRSQPCALLSGCSSAILCTTTPV